MSTPTGQDATPFDLQGTPTGTFAYPPVLRTLESLLEFWMSVEVPEDALVRFHIGYTQARAKALRADPSLQLPVMVPPMVRPLVRLSKMHSYLAPLPKEDRAKFRAMRFTLPTGEVGTMAELMEMFLVSEYRSCLVQSEVDEHNALVAELRAIRSEVTKAIDDQKSSTDTALANVQNAVVQQLTDSAKIAEHHLNIISRSTLQLEINQRDIHTL